MNLANFGLFCLFSSLINLQLGWPSPRLFTSSALLEGANEVLKSESDTAAALIYGPHIGHPPLRKSVAKWLSSIYSTSVDEGRICISNGASANLSNILLKFTDPLYTRKIFMIEPTYFLACPIFEDNGFQGKLRGIPEDNGEGIDFEFLCRELKTAETAAIQAAKDDGKPDVPVLKTGKNYPKIFKYIIYLVPTFSNPSAKTLSLDARKKLVDLARTFDALLVSDDVYDFLAWPQDPAAADDSVTAVPPRLVDIDREMPGCSSFGNTASNGSFSKVIGPGVRVGWTECTPAFARELAEVGSSSSGGAPSHLTSTFVDKMLRSGRLQSHIKNVLIPTYRQRYYTLMAAIEDFLVPLGVAQEVKKTQNSMTATAGGFFTYLRLPDDMPASRTVAAFAFQEYALRIAFGHMFVVAGDEGSTTRAEALGGFAKCIRLCWAWHEDHEIREGIERLATTIVDIRAMMQKGRDVARLAIGIR
ncbi:aminotransferase [Cadophora sp. DSE1049]|nr:aminotransferase [Cadophora sp. DSE1049]